MVILRLLSYLLIAATLMLLGYDAISWLQANGGEYSLFSIAKLIDAFCGAGTSAGLTGGEPGALQAVLDWPSWAVTGVIGLILAFVSRSN